ncbi:hypothetical protein [Draconibacterium sp.]|uniref:hypothetical protein n=1 Tax=Draconibacterium sp. TaxID=1965318 RepID=UPI0035640A2B
MKTALNPKVDIYLIDGCMRCKYDGTLQCKVNDWGKSWNCFGKLFWKALYPKKLNGSLFMQLSNCSPLKPTFLNLL